MATFTPSEYLKLARQDFKDLPADVCNDLLQVADKSDGGWHILYIPGYIPQKYHARMQAAWTAIAFRILFAGATDKYTLMQRHEMLNKVFRCIGNVRESAGR